MNEMNETNEMKDTTPVDKLNVESVKHWLTREVEVRLPKWVLVAAAISALALLVFALD